MLNQNIYEKYKSDITNQLGITLVNEIMSDNNIKSNSDDKNSNMKAETKAETKADTKAEKTNKLESNGTNSDAVSDTGNNNLSDNKVATTIDPDTMGNNVEISLCSCMFSFNFCTKNKK